MYGVEEPADTSFEAIPDTCPLLNLRLRGTIHVNAAKILDRLPWLQAVDLPVSGDGRELAIVIKSLKNLRELHLNFYMNKLAQNANESLFESIGTLDRLETLTLDELNDFPETFLALLRLPNLKSLFISPSDEVPPGMHAVVELISQMPQIESLGLYGDWVNDDTILQLHPLDNLTSLRIADTDVTDSGLRQLANHHRLQSLDLRFTKVTQEAMDVLYGTCHFCSAI